MQWSADRRLRLLAGGHRPKPDCRVAPKPPDGEPSLFLFRFYEAAVRDLTHPATSGHPIGQEFIPHTTGSKVQPP